VPSLQLAAGRPTLTINFPPRANPDIKASLRCQRFDFVKRRARGCAPSKDVSASGMTEEPGLESSSRVLRKERQKACIESPVCCLYRNPPPWTQTPKHSRV
jgi:hypothetical protein